MKKKYIICLVLIIIVGSCIFILKKVSNNHNNININNSTVIENTKNIQDLNVISQHNEYVLVIDDTYSELQTYSVYQNINANNYKKQFSLPEGKTIESRFICWTNDRIYVLGYNPASYKLSNGNIVDTGDLNKILGGTTGRIDKIIWIYNNFIYYTYSYNAEHFYGKISLDLNSVTIIQKDDLPKELNN